MTLKVKDELDVKPVGIFGGTTAGRGGLVDVIAGEKMSIAALDQAPASETIRGGKVDFVADIIVERRIFSVAVAASRGGAFGVEEIFSISEVKAK